MQNVVLQGIPKRSLAVNAVHNEVVQGKAIRCFAKGIQVLCKAELCTHAFSGYILQELDEMKVSCPARKTSFHLGMRV